MVTYKAQLQDGCNRRVSYVRISVTDRCNLRCHYCSSSDFSFISHNNILRYEEILHLLEIMAKMGVDKVRLTGGEPLVRRGLDELIARINLIDGIRDISLTTNGVLLKEQATTLRRAGLKRINVSLDTLDRSRFAEITGRDYFTSVRQGINEALDQGFAPVKINVVVMRGINDDEIPAFAELTRKLPLQVRFIEYMPIGSTSKWSHDLLVTGDEILERISALYGDLSLIPDDPGAGPARLYQLADGLGKVGVITALSNHFCDDCNRIRVTADGRLRPCLLADREYDLRRLLRADATDDEIAAVVRLALVDKGSGHGLSCNAERKCARPMASIGG